MPSSSSVVRQVMMKHDRHVIHSSRLKNGNRRVKCYAWRGNEEATNHLVEEIRKALDAHGCTEYDIRFRKNYPDDSIIVEVPTD